jgi:hypothetical protein
MGEIMNYEVYLTHSLYRIQLAITYDSDVERYLLFYKHHNNSDIEIPLCVLTENEKHLDKDRFEKFSLDPLINGFEINRSTNVWLKSDSFQTCVESYINWISINVHNKWRLVIKYNHMHDIDIILSFENKDDAERFDSSN